MSNWWVSREAVKRAAEIQGASRNIFVDAAIAGVSRTLENRLRRWFIPRTETRTYRWPPRVLAIRSIDLDLDADLIAVTTLKTKAQDSSPTTILAADFFLEPTNEGPPYNRIEIDQSSSSAFEGGDTPQRSISVLGRWGYSEDTLTAGTVSSGLASSSTATSMVCSDGSLIDVGDTLLIESEQVFVSERASAAEENNDLLNGALTADKAVVTVVVDDGTRYFAGEVILVNSEKMYIESITSNNLTVVRAYDGSTLAAHSDNDPVSVFRTLTIVRGVNGTTAATHANATAVAKYTPEEDIVMLTKAEVIAVLKQEKSGWGREIGQGEGAREWKGAALKTIRDDVYARYRRRRIPVAV